MDTFTCLVLWRMAGVKEEEKKKSKKKKQKKSKINGFQLGGLIGYLYPCLIREMLRQRRRRKKKKRRTKKKEKKNDEKKMGKIK